MRKLELKTLNAADLSGTMWIKDRLCTAASVTAVYLCTEGLCELEVTE